MMIINKEELEFMINESHKELMECRKDGIYTPKYNQQMGWYDCLLYLKEEYFGL